MTEDHHPHGLGYARTEASSRFPDDRAQVNRARQAAEALFGPRRQVTEPVAPTPINSADQVARKPRVLRVLPATPMHDTPSKLRTAPEPQRSGAVPPTQFARIRAWLKYGMTVHQIAQVYGVATGDIERVLHSLTAAPHPRWCCATRRPARAPLAIEQHART